MPRPPADLEATGTLVVRGDRVVYATERAAELLGRPSSELVGAAWADLLAPEDRSRATERQRRRLRGEPVPGEYEASVVLGDGGRRPVELRAELDGTDVVVRIRDVSRQAARRPRLEALAALGAAIQRERSEADVFARVREGLREAGLASMLVRAEAHGPRVEWACASRELEVAFAARAGEPLAGRRPRWTPFLEEAWRTGAAHADDWPAEVDALAPEGRVGEPDAAAPPAGLGQAVAVRLDERAAVRYLLVVVGDWLHAGDLAALRLFGAQVAAALDAARIIADLSRRNAELDALNRLGELAGEARDLAAFFPRAFEILCGASGCDGLGVYGIDDSAQELVLLHHQGVRDDLVDRVRRIPLASPFGDVVRERAPRVVTSGDPGLVLGELGFESGAWVPLVARSRVVGVFVAGFAGPPGPVRAALDLLAAAGAHFASAIESHRLLSDLRRRVGELALLHEVGRSMVATLETEQVLDVGMKNLARTVDCPIALLALATPDGARLEIRAVAGAPPSWIGVRFATSPPDASLVTRAFVSREAVAIEDAVSDPLVRQDLRERIGARAYLGLPLLVRDRSIGSVLLMETRRTRRFGAAEVERATAIANQLAVAVENARLYEDLRRSYADLARAQRRLIEQERLAALGEIAAVVAHEVRNPLGVIFNSLGSLRRLVRPSGDTKLLLDIMGEEADRLNRIVGDLLDFARPSLPNVRPEPLELVVDEAVRAALAESPAAIEVRREADPELPPVPLDARLVRQALLNVAANAVQAMPRGGRITVRIRRDGAAVAVELEDTGAGIPEEVRGRIFEPFFTTKASGTGLGLAVVKRIVEGHGGTVDVRSPPGAGTAVRLRFPLDPAVAGKEADLG